ncbi:uncharacterized protein DS421_15g497140 [Arachis hypogaea]|nr:uncharacterized protein DS421_15g497140 [Arachis hypogaea]
MSAFFLYRHFISHVLYGITGILNQNKLNITPLHEALPQRRPRYPPTRQVKD